MSVTTLQKFLDQLSTNRNVKSVVSEFNKLGAELKTRGQKLNSRLNAEKAQALKQAHVQVQKAVKSVSTTQKQLDREVKKAVGRILASADQVETNLEYYRKKAVEQGRRIEKMLKTREAAARKASRGSKKTTTRKAASTKKSTTRKTK